MDLFTYYRSTSSYRVRIALALKGLDYAAIPVNLLLDGGEQRTPGYKAVNPQGRVPALRLDDGVVITQSLAIIEYLEECYPQPALLAQDAVLRARQRAVAALVGCDIHPLHNVSVLNRLRGLGHDEPAILSWIEHWIGEGLQAVEQLIEKDGFCFGTSPGLADIYLLPQLYAAHRYNVQLSAYPRILRVERLAMQHPAFQQAHPDAQSDKPE
ncbi:MULTISPECIES: maleylacetoacetate isomerase [Pseudomonas syringae group]|uniref:Maleylacetoacetate isomerase n=6 Tax=Pseudomonas syringae group TaxID=136849 RepID=A0A2K4WSX7_PSESX|nr:MULTISPECIES: maleylacetoacetate isomerase [Pseudomonas syringae group]MBI6727833.1 maleylacetoacetate isomerase [Pseudomonas amygdali]AVB15503.1 maleylacetoacetate isomerase [Pseudomonas amygdali pv. morsprunorum]KPC49278.1 Maleylacetoacetate isomerase [Pseudomonas amygdali pv. morsprunorum]KPW92080.1 Maleylacetoacetate isomerase [Pseudomonas syringae pv. cerasicola]KPX84190.1 Maleylacetoacetate isomerase [Pseudomonas meliae]